MPPDAVSLDGFPHYMLKEIFEQPETIRNTMRGRLSLDEATAVFGGLNLTPQQLRSVNRILLTACGTSWHAALVGEYLIEELAQIPVEVEYASELRYRNPPLEQRHAAVRHHAKRRNGRHAGRAARNETQGTSDAGDLQRRRQLDRPGGRRRHLSARRARKSASPRPRPSPRSASCWRCWRCTSAGCDNVSFDAGMRIIEQLQELPDRGRPGARDQRRRAASRRQVLPLHELPVPRPAVQLSRRRSKGRSKLKEISYIHAEGYPAAEMKHGPIALVDEHTPSVFIMPQGLVYDKVMSNLEEIKARGGPVIAIVVRGRHARGRPGRRRDRSARTSKISCSRSSRSFRCNCWPITSPCCAAATSTSRATWPRA